MKSLILPITAVLLLSFSSKDKDPVYGLKFIQKHLSYIPAGSLAVGNAGETVNVEHFYMFNQEVSNGLYLEYLHSLQAQGQTELYSTALPDTLVWLAPLTLNEPYTRYYFRHPAYREYPLTGVTHAQSLAFCSWLTQVYNADPKRQFKKVLFTLPDSIQREYAANGGLKTTTYPWAGSYMRNRKGAWLANFRDIGQKDIHAIAHADVTAPVTSYYPNGYGLYNMSGNVEEFLLHPGHAMGGSWMDSSDKLQNKVQEIYPADNSASNERGFRFVMQVLEE